MRLLNYIDHQLRQEFKCKSVFEVSLRPNDVWFYDFKSRAFAVTQLINNFYCRPVVSLCCVSTYRSPACMCIKKHSKYDLIQQNLSVLDDVVFVPFNDNEIYIQQHNDNELKITNQCLNLCEW